MDARLLSFKVLLEYENSNRWLKTIRNEYFITLNPSENISKRTIVLTNEIIKWKRLLDSIIDGHLTKNKSKLKITHDWKITD